jgi:hypothetical protein
MKCPLCKSTVPDDGAYNCALCGGVLRPRPRGR